MNNKLVVSDILKGLKTPGDIDKALSNIKSEKPTVLTDKTLMILADFSGSMAGMLNIKTTKISALKKALIENLAPKLSGWTYAVIGFGLGFGYQWIVHPTTDPARIQDIDRYGSMGGTPMYGTLTEAWNWSKYNTSKARFILISDGCPTDCDRDMLLGQCQINNSIPIDTIGVGDMNGYGYDEVLLREISRITGGIFSKVDSVDKLANTLIALSPEKRMLLGTTGK